MKKQLIVLLVLLIIAGGAWYGLSLQKKENPALTIPSSDTSSSKNTDGDTVVYKNDQYAFEFSYPKQIVFNSPFTVSTEASTKEFPAGTPVPFTVESAVDQSSGHLLDLSVPAIYFTVSVLSKPANFKTLADYVQDEIETAKDAGSDSAAGVFVSDANPVPINGKTAISYSIQDGSVMNNRTLLYYLENKNNIYILSYFYAGALYDRSSGEKIAQEDELLKVAADQEIVGSFKFL